MQTPDRKPIIDLIVPVLNESHGMVPHVENMIHTVREAGYVPHVILVDDGSSDDTWLAIEDLSQRYVEIEGVRLSRNFGKDSAIFSGFEYVQGEAAITIDSDGQHPISMLPQMLQAWRNGQRVVHAVKVQRQGESVGRRLRAHLINYCMSKLMNTNVLGASDFKLLDRSVVEILRRHGTTNAIYRFLVSDLGFPSTAFPMSTLPSTRVSRWPLSKLFQLATRAIMFHTDVPLKAFALLVMLMIGLAASLFAILSYALIFGSVPSGYSTLLVLSLLNLCITVVGVTGVAVYLKGTLDLVAGRGGAIVWQRTGAKPESGDESRA